MDVLSVRIEKFKRISSLELIMNPLTVIIGGNNSGKSSFLQGIHFAITTMQSLVQSRGSNPLKTISADQLLYKPAGDPLTLGFMGAINQNSGPSFYFNYKADATREPETFSLSLKKGKNANLSASFDEKNSFFQRASDRTRPLSIFVPGLAGIAIREEKRTDAIVTTGIAQGDSNLYLRNVLLRIIQNPDKLDRFHTLIKDVFDVTISSEYDELTHQYITIKCKMGDTTIPLELVGTGCLQAIQLIAYVTMYDPLLLLLDEPDAHLHPSNQRTLAAVLRSITASYGTKIALATHSRHVFDETAHYEETRIAWLSEGELKPFNEKDDLSLLLDLGALDKFESVSTGNVKVVVLTEDTKSSRLQFLLEKNGFKKGEYLLQSYHGVDNIKMALPVAEFFTKFSQNTYVLIHRDKDGILDEEANSLRDKFQKQLPDRCSLMFTQFTDIEHQFCQPGHLAAVYGMTLDAAEAFVERAKQAKMEVLIVQFTNKRSDAKRSYLRNFENPPSAEKIIENGFHFSNAKGKTLFGAIQTMLTAEGMNAMLQANTMTDFLKIGEIEDLSKRVWPEVQTEKS